MVQPYWPDRFIGKIVDLDPLYSGAPELSAPTPAIARREPSKAMVELVARRMVNRFGADPASWVLHVDFVRDIIAASLAETPE